MLVILDAAVSLGLAAQLLEHADEPVDLAADAVEGDGGLAARLQRVELLLRQRQQRGDPFLEIEFLVEGQRRRHEIGRPPEAER